MYYRVARRSAITKKRRELLAQPALVVRPFDAGEQRADRGVGWAEGAERDAMAGEPEAATDEQLRARDHRRHRATVTADSHVHEVGHQRAGHRIGIDRGAGLSQDLLAGIPCFRGNDDFDAVSPRAARSLVSPARRLSDRG